MFGLGGTELIIIIGIVLALLAGLTVTIGAVIWFVKKANKNSSQ